MASPDGLRATKGSPGATSTANDRGNFVVLVFLLDAHTGQKSLATAPTITQAAGMSDETLQPPVGASVWELDMFTYLTTHAKTEGQLLDGYLNAAKSTSSKALAYVIGLLVEDERRHHRHFTDLAQSLKVEAELSGGDPVVPWLDFQQADREAVLELTQQLIANEEKDAAELKRLRKDMRDFEDTTLWALLVETMQLDTEKHLTILRFVKHHCKSARP